MRIFSPAFAHENEIPDLYTCAGKDISPPLAWDGLPADAKSLVLIVDDPDAPDPAAPKMTWVHWVLFDIPPSARGLPEGVMSARELPAGAREGINDWQARRYRGPCPPVGRHRYFFKLYALSSTLPDPGEGTKAEVERAMQGLILRQAQLVGTYEHKK